MKVSCILPSFLETFPGAAPNREQDFLRAVSSVRHQSYKDWELIIISDGCKKTIDLYNKYLKIDSRIKLVCLEKALLFSGRVRQSGLDICIGDVIMYIDSDDIFLEHHLLNIVSCFDIKYDWLYFNAYYQIKELKNQLVPYIAELEQGKINTGCFAHRRGLKARWDVDKDGKPNIGVQENWRFIEQLILNESYISKKIYGAGYIICHSEIKSFSKVETPSPSL